MSFHLSLRLRECKPNFELNSSSFATGVPEHDDTVPANFKIPIRKPKWPPRIFKVFRDISLKWSGLLGTVENERSSSLSWLD